MVMEVAASAAGGSALDWDRGVTLFVPCYVDQLAPQVAQAAVALLGRGGINWEYPPDQTCCGQFAYNSGAWATARRLMRHFLAVFGQAQNIVSLGASCLRTIRRHYPQLAETRAEAVQVAQLGQRTWELSQVLGTLPPDRLPLAWPGKMFLHRSCAARELGLLPGLQGLLARVKGAEIFTLPPTYACCGFGGLFSLKQAELSQAIGWRYVEAVLATGAEVLVSPEAGCLLHLHGLASAQGLELPMLTVAEFLHQAAIQGG